MKAFGIGEAISFGWKTFKSNAALLVGITLVSGVIGYVPTAIDDMRKNGQLDLGILTLVLLLVFVALGQLLELGSALINLKLVDGKKAAFGDLFSCGKLLIRGIVAAFLYGIIVAAGLVCLVIPGIYLGIRLMFYRYLIVDKNMGQIQALSTSWTMTHGNVWNLLGFSVVLIALNILGAILALVGLLVTVPLSMVAMAYVYRKLSANLK